MNALIVGEARQCRVIYGMQMTSRRVAIAAIAVAAFASSGCTGYTRHESRTERPEYWALRVVMGGMVLQEYHGDGCSLISDRMGRIWAGAGNTHDNALFVQVPGRLPAVILCDRLQ
jgi:hypothetical protein